MFLLWDLFINLDSVAMKTVRAVFLGAHPWIQGGRCFYSCLAGSSGF